MMKTCLGGCGSIPLLIFTALAISASCGCNGASTGGTAQGGAESAATPAAIGGRSPGGGASAGSQASGASDQAAPATVGNGTIGASAGTPASAAPAAQAGNSAGGHKPASEPPVQEVLFEGWPEPQYVLFITGQQQGYIEPCGCSGLTNQKGGLVRRHTLKQQLVDRGWDVVLLDVGNQVRRFGRQPEIMFQMTVEGMKQMGYGAIGLGPDDLRLSAGELLALTVSEGENDSPFVCANTAIIDPSLTPKYRILEAAGRKIGVTAVLGDQEQAKVTSDEIIKQSPVDALNEVWPALKEADCDVYVLLAHTSIDDSIKLAQQFPHFDVVVTAGGVGEPTFEAPQIPGTKSILVQVGTKAMHVGVVGVFEDSEDSPRLRYQRVPLDARFPDSRPMLDLLASYQEQLKVAGLEGLGVKPIPHPSGLKYVGSDSCKDCHEEEFDIWDDTPHSWALDSLVEPGERSEIPRHFDPECLSCHVVGWNPQKYFPYVSGYLGLDETPLMYDVGCENCHGPGSAHNDAEALSKDEALLEKLRVQMRLPLEEAEKKCMECHDLDNSPDFHVPGAFEEYWEQIEH